MTDPKRTFRASATRSPTVNELTTDVNVALKLLDPDTAEAIVGPKPADEYGILIKGTRAVHSMMYAVLKQHGLKDNQASLKAAAQALTMLLQIVNYAYALGLKRGREER